MNIKVYGTPQKMSPELAQDALAFYARELMHKNLLRNLTINLFFVRDLVEDTNNEAICCWDDCNLRPRTFIMKVDDGLSKKKTLEAIAHEVVHIKQWAKRELRAYVHTDDSFWHGTRVDELIVPYRSLPWEVEAWRLEPRLYREFNRCLKLGSRLYKSKKRRQVYGQTKSRGSSSSIPFVP